MLHSLVLFCSVECTSSRNTNSTSRSIHVRAGQLQELCYSIDGYKETGN